ncbi:head decoration protein [Hyphomonas pacifica]|uniref:Head decoration protein n=1 Tax=Hyphomonas pacifica TaxID=1280941 RepID=A0A8B2PH31_9PROT|nr:head decoration protein [Hyphomonas pacifica]RAN30640.1 hypothetical protein HY3_05680 [Hyphomonas pacifica]
MSLHVDTKVRPLLPSDVISREPEPEISREEITLLAGAGGIRSVSVGTVMGQITASKKVVQLDPDASDGSENAYGVMITNATAKDGVDAKGVAICRLATLQRAGLIWPDGIAAGAKEAAISALAANMVILR